MHTHTLAPTQPHHKLLQVGPQGRVFRQALTQQPPHVDRLVWLSEAHVPAAGERERERCVSSQLVEIRPCALPPRPSIASGLLSPQSRREM